MARYNELKEILKQRIISGKYAEKSLLPSEMELSEEFEVNRHTIRHALEVLSAEGYILKHKGKGSIVKRVRPSLGLLSFTGFSEALRSADIKVDTKTLLGPVDCDWPAKFFVRLSDAEQSSGCVFLKRLRMANSEPVMLENTYLPKSGIDFDEKTKLINGSLFETLLRVQGIEMLNLQQEIKAMMADDELSKWLKLKRKTPILYIRRRYITSLPEVYVYSELYVNTSSFSIGNFDDNGR